MAVSITKRPLVTVASLSPGNAVSNWLSAWVPILYTFACEGSGDPTYRIKIYIYEYGTNTLISVLSRKPINHGFVLDVSVHLRSVLASLLNPTFGTSPVTINCKDQKSTIKFYIKYQEITDSSQNSIISDESNAMYATSSAQQWLNATGSNMAPNVPFGIDLAEDSKAKFLTAFKSPVKFKGYPLIVSFIFPDTLSGNELKVVEDRQDINKGHIATIETSVDRSQVNSINLLKLDYDYEDDISFVDLSLSTGQHVDDRYVYEGYVEDGYSEIK